MKLTHVGFRAHVKLASRIVSYRIVLLNCALFTILTFTLSGRVACILWMRDLLLPVSDVPWSVCWTQQGWVLQKQLNRSRCCLRQTLMDKSNHVSYVRIRILHNFTTLWVRKKQDTKLLPITSPNVNRFSFFFTVRLSSKFATYSV